MPALKVLGRISSAVASARPATVKNACMGRRSRLRTAMRKEWESRRAMPGALDEGRAEIRRRLGAHRLGGREPRGLAHGAEDADGHRAKPDAAARGDGAADRGGSARSGNRKKSVIHHDEPMAQQHAAEPPKTTPPATMTKANFR